MCNTIIVHDHEYSTPRELSRLVGGMKHLIWRETSPFSKLRAGEDWRNPDLCLCPVNLPDTLTQAG